MAEEDIGLVQNNNNVNNIIGSESNSICSTDNEDDFLLQTCYNSDTESEDDSYDVRKYVLNHVDVQENYWKHPKLEDIS